MKKKCFFLFFLFVLYYVLYQAFSLHFFCLFHQLTGFYCPGCGVTRMGFSLLEGNVYQAFRYNPLVFLLLLLYLIYFLFWQKKYPVIPSKILYSIILILIFYGVLRNLDSFSFLAPTFLG